MAPSVQRQGEEASMGETIEAARDEGLTEPVVVLGPNAIRFARENGALFESEDGGMRLADGTRVLESRPIRRETATAPLRKMTLELRAPTPAMEEEAHRPFDGRPTPRAGSRNGQAKTRRAAKRRRAKR
jgi:hypothetical protein